MEKASGQHSTFYTLDQADEQFDYVMRLGMSEPFATEDFKERARPMFREEFARAAVDGKVEIVDSLYVYIARTE